jgi:rhomboid protease GluP
MMNQPQPVRRVALPLATPRLIWMFFAVNVLMFLVETLLGGSTSTATLVRLGAKVNTLIALGQYWRLVTPMFLHIGLGHIVVNSYALYAIGPEVETLYGHARFLTIYVLSGIAGNVMSYAFTPNLSAGASTALFGLIGAQLVFYYRERQRLGAFGQQRLITIVGIIIINLFIGMSGAGVDNFGHLGGFIGGVLLGWLLCPVYEIEYGWDGQALVQDRNSLRRELPGVFLFVVLLIVAASVVTLREVGRPEVRLEQGAAAFESGNYAAALPLLEQAASDLPEDTRAHYLLAAAYFNLKRYQEAAPAFERSLELAPDLADAHFYLAVSYLQLDRRSDALPHLRQYLTLAPTGENAGQAQSWLAQLGP